MIQKLNGPQNNIRNFLKDLKVKLEKVLNLSRRINFKLSHKKKIKKLLIL